MSDEPTLKDIRDLIDGLAIATAKNFGELNTKVDAGFAELKGDMGDVKECLARIERRLDHHETRIEALESK